jgi:tetratricopeptide (TPR) repeat protein
VGWDFVFWDQMQNDFSLRHGGFNWISGLRWQGLAVLPPCKFNFLEENGSNQLVMQQGSRTSRDVTFVYSRVWLVVVFLLIFPVLIEALASRASAASSGDGLPRESREQAETQAIIGHNQLHLGRLSDAQANCDASLKLDPSNDIARDCLDWVAVMLIDQDLNNAEAKLLSGDNREATILASKYINGGASSKQRERAWNIISRSRSKSFRDKYVAVVPVWLREFFLTLVFIVGLCLMLLTARKILQRWERGKWYGVLGKTKWSMLPLKELPGPDLGTGIATDELLDALARVGHELTRDTWQPKLLLLKPTPPANYEPALITDFLSAEMNPLVLVPAAGDLRLEWQLHQIQLDQAVQNLQLKTATGIDIGSVARFLRSIVDWMNAGAPRISGVAQTSADNSVSIHLAASGGPTQLVAVTASTSAAPGIDPTHLSAERAALKFLFRMRYPFMTNDEIDGFSALRQGACQFAQFAGTVPGTGNDAQSRRSILAKAAFNFGFFRASIPPRCGPTPPSKRCVSLNLTDDIRQAILLAEGVTHALIGGESDQMLAIDCFRQLEDWPGSTKTVALRQQATYNEAVVWRQWGAPGRCVLMLTELLGERAPDTVEAKNDEVIGMQSSKPLPDAIRFPVRLARLAAFATYSRDQWQALPSLRSQLLIDDAKELINDLCSLLAKPKDISAHDYRFLNYMHVEALRGIGHVELLRVITGPASTLYEDNRPIGLKKGSASNEAREGLHRAINWMLKCEQVAPTCDLFCDLAEAYLLLKDFTRAQGYARHATLESNPSNPYYERAYYIAAESFFLDDSEQCDKSKILANKYVNDYKGTVTLAEFKSLRADLPSTTTLRSVA